MLNKERQRIEDLFFDFVGRKQISSKPPLSFLPPEQDKSLYFTNATIVNFKEDVAGGASKHLATKQKCLRLHNIAKILDDDYKIEWLSVFNMVGTIIPPDQLPEAKSNLIELMSAVYGIPKDKLLFLADVKDERLIKDIPQHMLVFNSQPQSFYDWHFGSNSLRGKGLTFSARQDDGSIVDIGNLIEITDGKNVLGYECAYGLECLKWAQEQKSSILEMYPIFNYVNPHDPNVVKVIDALMSIMAIESVGVEPTNKTDRGQILRKLYRNLVYLAEKSSCDTQKMAQMLKILSETEFDDTANPDQILGRFDQFQTLVNCQRNAFLTRKKEIQRLYDSGAITRQEAEQKMLGFAEGKYYIDKHERSKYFKLDADSNTQSKINNVLLQNRSDER